MHHLNKFFIWTWSLTFVVLYMISYVDAGEFVSACFNNTQKTLQITCGSGKMLQITKAFYGFSNSGQCSFTPNDCTTAEHEAYPCTGQNTCSINLPSGRYGQKIPECNKYSSYFQVEYECEPVILTSDICRTQLLTAQRGFIATPRYPSNYRSNTDCLTRIRVHKSQNINLTIIDMDLEINGTYTCEDWMDAYSTTRSVTLCGRRTNEKLTTLESNEISIRFQSDNKGEQKGFWVYYEAYPPLPTTEPPKTDPPTEPAKTPQQQNQDSGTTDPTSQVAKSTSSSQSSEKLPFVAIVAGVIGTLTFVLIVLLVLLALKWWREKKQTSYKRNAKDIEYMDARNPAFRSSTGTEFQGVEIYYNC